MSVGDQVRRLVRVSGHNIDATALTSTVEELAGHPARSFAVCAADHADHAEDFRR